MLKSISKNSERTLTVIVFSWVVIIRIFPLLSALWLQQPLTYHTGGLFYAFIKAIQQHNYHFPHQIPYYTHNGLPFVYPPLAFIIAALFDQCLNLDSRSILLFNSLVSTLAVIVLYLTLNHSTTTKIQKLITTLAFATLPSTYMEHLPGEGLAESLGTLCFILFFYALNVFNKKKNYKNSLWLGASIGINVLTSPGTAYAVPMLTIIYSGYTWLQKGTHKIQLFKLISTAIVTSLLVASPYLIHVNTTYGYDELISAFSHQQTPDFAHTLLRTSLNLFSLYNGPSLWTLLILMGLADCITRKQWLWLISALFVASIPREGQWLSAITATTLITFGLRSFDKVLYPYLHKNTLSHQLKLIGRGLIFLVAIYSAVWIPLKLLVNLSKPYISIYKNYVTPEEAQILGNLKDELPHNSTILMFGNENEWAPLLAQHTLLNVWYGTEWAPQKETAIMALNWDLVAVHSATELWQVLQTTQTQHPDILPLPDFIYISKYNTLPRQSPLATSELVADLHNTNLFSIYIDTPTVLLVIPNTKNP